MWADEKWLTRKVGISGRALAPLHQLTEMKQRSSRGLKTHWAWCSRATNMIPIVFFTIFFWCSTLVKTNSALALESSFYMINKSKVKINPAQDYLAHSGPVQKIPKMVYNRRAWCNRCNFQVLDLKLFWDLKKSRISKVWVSQSARQCWQSDMIFVKTFTRPVFWGHKIYAKNA